MKAILFTLTALLLMTSQAWATQTRNFSEPDNKQELVEKCRKDVEGAKPNDWLTLTQSAEACINHQVNLTEAIHWLERSLEIKDSGYNWRVLGDYYAEKHETEKAVDAYQKSLQVGTFGEAGFDAAKVQAKILQLENSF